MPGESDRHSSGKITARTEESEFGVNLPGTTEQGRRGKGEEGNLYVKDLGVKDSVSCTEVSIDHGEY